MSIEGIYVRPYVINARRVFVGNGPMLSGANYMGYNCTLRPNLSRIAAVYDGEGDYVKLSPGESNQIRVFILSDTEALYGFRAECEYTIGNTHKTVTIGQEFGPVYFFKAQDINAE